MTKHQFFFHKQTGFSILEFMIGQAIALVLISGLLAFIAPSLSAIGSAKSNSDIQDSGRLATEHLQNAIAYAGYQGCNIPQSYTSLISPSQGVVSPRLQSWAYAPFGLRGFDANETERIADTLGASWRNTQYQYLENRIGDMLAVQYPVGSALILEQHDPTRFLLTFRGRKTDLLQSGQIIQLNDCIHAARLQISSNTAVYYSEETNTTTASYAPTGSINCHQSEFTTISLGPGITGGCRTTTLATEDELFRFDEGTHGHIVKSVVYYVGYDTAANAPALKRSGMAANAARIYTETLVEGIENLRLQYGMDIDNDGVSDQLLNAVEVAEFNAGIGANPWGNVVAVKMSILLRSSRKTKDASQSVSIRFPAINGQKVNCQSSRSQSEEEHLSQVQACPFWNSDRKQYDRYVITSFVNMENSNT